MSSLSDGARQLPLRHISIRVPWNDTGWTGCVCKNPKDNPSCLILPRIRETKNEDLESSLAGKSWEELDEKNLPACVSERGSFMAPFDFTRNIKHPYSKTSEAHKHIIPTPYRYPAYSAACIPFNWMLKNPARDKAEVLELGFDPELESRAHEIMGFETNWVQTKKNQLVMLDTFFSAVQAENSLCFFYAKRIPFIEDTRRVIIGVGWVRHIGNPVEYRYSGGGELNSVLWERAVQHSIRPKFKDGFILPYHDILNYLNSNPDEEPSQYVAFAPDEHYSSFSYTTEHVTNDGAIAVLLSCMKALQNISKIAEGPWNQIQQWIDKRLNELWNMRGPCPGLGSALFAFGIEHGNLLAYEVEKHLTTSEKGNPWRLVDHLFRNPDEYPKELRKFVKSSLSRKWESLPHERTELLKLLSRFELTNNQATCYYVHEDKRREEYRISVTDSEVIENPYLLYETDRRSLEPISLPVVDRGLFPDETLRNKFPLEKPSKLDDATDDRRIRAFVLQQLEKAANQGHSIQSRKQIIQEIRELDVQPACSVDGDLMNLAEDFFSPTIQKVNMQDGETAYQLDRLNEMRKIINTVVKKRLKGRRHEVDVPWRDRLDNIFGGAASPDDKLEQNAREEKTAAIKELFFSRISVLIGPAGTGKTTLLKVLCKEEKVKEGGILALAPTGKARVRMEQQTGLHGAKTIAQFLMPLDRYEPKTGNYRLSKRPGEKGAKTVLIDEASMLTEDQLAAVLNALKGVERLILIGDPRQLPPIGVGRPFLDIVRELTPEDIEYKFPRVGQGYAELTVRRRQRGEFREDLLLAEWFSGRELDPGADEIWTRISEDSVSEYLRFVQWDTSEKLREKLIEVIVEELELSGVDDQEGLEKSLGGSFFNGYVYFHCGYGGRPGACKKVEDWQILSPVRNEPYGVEALNRLIQNTFRTKTKDLATKRYRKIAKPMGSEEIIYGDKVINLKNQRRKGVYPKEDALQYVANGEIGIVVGQFKGRSWPFKKLPWKLEVEFASQPDFKYEYGPWEFGEEAEPKLELAYALTIHKVQGSEFGLTLLIIPNPCRLLSRELLYTALTRQQNRVIIFHQGDRHELKRFSDDYYSDAAQRLTNLFQPPKPALLENRFLEDRLIHRTRRGESVRSKSEVIIADLLYSKDIDYVYEYPFVGKDGVKRYPDFFFEDDETGLQIYWEHLGMLQNPEYKERWERKLIWYREQGVLRPEEGEGPKGTLIITKDDDRGGIRSDEIEALLDSILVI